MSRSPAQVRFAKELDRSDFSNPPPRPFQFIVFTASTDTYKRLRLTTGDRIHVCSLNSDFDLSVEEEIFRKHWDVLHSIPLAKWRDAAVLHERLLTGHSTAPDKDRQRLMSLVEKHPLLGDSTEEHTSDLQSLM